MEDISEILKEARNKKGIEIEQVARETNISRHYIEGLESDNYTVFPAETYVIGFLRIYCDYLGLSSEEIIQSYKQIQLQEVEIPQEILLPKKSINLTKILIVLATIVGVALIVSGIFWFTGKSKVSSGDVNKVNKDSNLETTVITERKTVNYEIKDEKFEERLFEGDGFSLTIENKKHDFTVKKISPNLELDTEIGLQIIRLGENVALDINDDTYTDLEIAVADLDKEDSSKGVLLMVSTGTNISESKKVVDVGATAISPSETKEYTTLFEGGSAYPVTLNANFRGYCFFRYEIDRRERKERYYQKNENFTIQANNGIRIWASNGNTVSLQLVAGGKTVDLAVSRPGEVIVQDLKWIKDNETGRFKFVVINVE